MSDRMDVVVPDLGGADSAAVLEIVAHVGDTVPAESALLVLESDKATMDVTNVRSGRVLEWLVAVGDEVVAGQVVARLATSDEETCTSDCGSPTAADPAPLPAKSREISTAGAAAPHAAPARGAGVSKRIYAGPAVRRLAREVGVELAAITGTAARGRILAKDVKAHVRMLLGRGDGEATSRATPSVSTAELERYGPVTYEPLSRIQKISGARLAASWASIPHVTQHDIADVTQIESYRHENRDALAARGIRLTPLAFLLRALAIALTEMPRFGAALCEDGTTLAIRRYCHLGFAVDTPDGLVVAVVHDACGLDVFGLATRTASLSAAARDRKLTTAQLSGSVITVSSLGGIGGTHFTPIINPPQVALLGAGRAQLVPACVGADIVPRMMLPLSLSYDHRVIDGVAGARFTRRIAALLQDLPTLTAPVC